MKLLVNLGGWYDFHYSIMQCCYDLDLPNGWTKEVVVTYGHNTAQCRNEGIAHAVTHGFDYIFFCDGDNLVQKDTIIKLSKGLEESGGDLITGVYRQGPTNEKMNFSFHTPDRGVKSNWCLNREYPKEIFQIDAAGFGCVLCKTSLFSKLPKPYFMFTETENEDIYFAENLRVAGIKFFCDGSVYAGHLKRIVV